MQITLRGAHEAVEIAEGLVGLVAGKVLGGSGHHNGNGNGNGDGAAAEPAADAPAAGAPAAERPAPAPQAPAPAAESPAAPPPTPAAEHPTAESLFPGTGHVSEEAELVEEVAEPGAEDGAGAELRIAEPWDGYRTMKAADIVARLSTASREELATVELYELAGRNRKSVVVAAQRALKLASPPRA